MAQKGAFRGGTAPATGLDVAYLRPQRHAFRLETRARELAVMARLSLKRRSRRETEFPQRKRGEACESALSHGGKARSQSIYS